MTGLLDALKLDIHEHAPGSQGRAMCGVPR